MVEMNTYQNEANAQTPEEYSKDYYNRLDLDERRFEMEEGYKLVTDRTYYEEMMNKDFEGHEHGGPEFTQEFKDRMRGMFCYVNQQAGEINDTGDASEVIKTATDIDINEFGYADEKASVNEMIKSDYDAFKQNKYVSMKQVLGHDVVDHQKFIESFNPSDEELENVDISNESVGGKSLEDALDEIDRNLEKQKQRRARHAGTSEPEI